MIRFHNTPAGQSLKEQYSRYKQGLPQFTGGKQPSPDAASGGALPSYLGGTPMMYPQAMPGQLESLAAQLSAGFGQPASAYMKQMDALYNPVQVGPPPAPVPTQPAPVAPTAGAPMMASPATGAAPSMLGLWGQKAGTRMSRGNR